MLLTFWMSCLTILLNVMYFSVPLFPVSPNLLFVSFWVSSFIYLFLFSDFFLATFLPNFSIAFVILLLMVYIVSCSVILLFHCLNSNSCRLSSCFLYQCFFIYCMFFSFYHFPTFLCYFHCY